MEIAVVTMKVTFVYPDIFEYVPDYKGTFYTGIALLSAVLKHAGHSTSLIHITNPRYTTEDFACALNQHQPDIIAFSSTTNGYPVVKEMAACIKNVYKDIPTIYGGIHPTLAPEESIQTDGINMICVGEGEGCLLDVCTALEQGKTLDNIPNLYLRKNTEVVRNPLRRIIENLDELPFPDRELFDYPHLYFEQREEATFIVSRGCPYSCTYCSNEALRNLYKGLGGYVRFRSVNNVIQEIQQVLEDYPFIKSLHFDDDILFLKSDWAQEFVELYRQRISFPFCCNIRPNFCNEKIIQMLSYAGCYELRIGLESGNEYIRKEILNRNLEEDTIINAFHTARKYGIKVMSFNMIGLPHENPSRILDTIKLNAHCGVNDIRHTIFYPYPGTRLYEFCRDENLLTERRVINYDMDTVLNLPNLSCQQLHMFWRYFHTFVKVYAYLYLLPKFLSRCVEFLLDTFLTCRLAPTVLRWSRPFVHVLRLELKSLKRYLLGKNVTQIIHQK
ncbi:MAG: radical SAM protein [bacterium]